MKKVVSGGINFSLYFSTLYDVKVNYTRNETSMQFSKKFPYHYSVLGTYLLTYEGLCLGNISLEKILQLLIPRLSDRSSETSAPLQQQ